MSWVLVFMMWSNGYDGEGLAALELKQYSTYEACKTAAKMAQNEHIIKNRDRVVAKGEYFCIAKPD